MLPLPDAVHVPPPAPTHVHVPVREAGNVSATVAPGALLGPALLAVIVYVTLPPGVAPNQRIKMVIRVELTRQGALAQDPAVMDAANPSIGYPLMQSVMRALRQCAPYSLPPDKYKEWRVLDIDFSPDQMMGS